MDTKKYKDTFELNVVGIRVELAKIDKSKSWLARQLGFSRQYIHQLIEAKSLKHVEDIAKVLKIPVNYLLSAKI